MLPLIVFVVVLYLGTKVLQWLADLENDIKSGRKR
jgi:hypothetical protein